MPERRFTQLPLRTVLIVPLLIQAVGAVGLTGYLCLRNGEQAVNALAAQLRNEIATRIDQQLSAHLELPHRLNQATVDAVARGQVRSQDLVTDQYFVQQARLYPQIRYIYYGFAASGDYIGAARVGLPPQLALVAPAANGRVRYFAADSVGRRAAPLSTEPDPYDLDARPWYRVALLGRQPVWGEISLDSSHLTITASQPAYDPQGRILGVAAVGLSLADLSRFLQDLSIGRSRKAFIVERSGLLVATSVATDPPFRRQEQRLSRLSAAESSSPLIREVFEHLRRQFGDLSKIDRAQQLEYTVGGARQFLEIRPYRDGRGLDWLIGVVVPESDFAAQIVANRQLTIALGLGAMGSALLLGLYLSRQIVRPLCQLSRAATAVAAGELDQRLPGDVPIVELNRMVNAFNSMIAQLRQSIAQLQQTNETLEARIQERTRRLQEQKRLYQALVEQQTDLICLAQPDTTITFVNAAYCRFFGSSLQQLVGTRWLDKNLSEERAEIWKQLAQLTPTQPLREHQDRNINALGAERWIHWTNRGLFDEQGLLIEIQSVGRDITERIQAEQALRQSEMRYELATQSARVSVWEWLAQPDQFYIDRNLAYMLGYAPDEIPSDLSGWLAQMDPPDRRRTLEAIRGLRQGSALEYCIEHRLRHKDGSWRWVLARGKGIVDDAGQVTRAVGTVTDITERKQAEEALLASEARFRGIFERAPVGIALDTLSGDPLAVNPALVEMLGYSQPELRALDYRSYTHPADLEQEERCYRELLARKYGSYQLEKRCLRRDGSQIWVRVRVSLIVDGAGSPQLSLGILEDITAQKQAEADLHQAKEAAEAANRAKSTFLASMSHELRSPLNAVLGFTQLMSRSPELSAEHQEYLGIIRRSGDHLLTLINQVLDLSKIEAGRVTFVPNAFDLDQMLRDLEEMFRLKAEDKDLALTIDGSDLPRYVRTDQVKLRQILINLLSNAIKFTSTGGVALTAEGEATEQSCRIRFAVCDTGPGIDPAEIDQLFVAFEQTEVGRQSQEGTGLGLAISHKFAQILGGELRVSSQLGQGSCFAFSIPVEIVSAKEVAPGPDPQIVVALAPGQPRYRILVVDDKPYNRLLMVKLLSPLGFEVREASHGREALAVWEQWDPHLIWMDMRMPVMDGYEATQQIKATTKGQATAVIALTASTLEEERQVVLSTGCDDFLRKPFREAEIFELMHKHLGVVYRYAAPDPNGPSLAALSPPPLVEVLAALPPELLRRLHQAAIDADSEATLATIAQLPGLPAAVAQQLHDWIHDFRFDKITSVTEALTR